MEQMLIKMAQRLDRMDQASLETLWEKYAQIVNAFEPTARWEEAVFVLSFIQAKYWKNQLFNTQWAMRSKDSDYVDLDLPGASVQFSGMMDEFSKKKAEEKQEKASIIPFTPKID